MYLKSVNDSHSGDDSRDPLKLAPRKDYKPGAS